MKILIEFLPERPVNPLPGGLGTRNHFSDFEIVFVKISNGFDPNMHFNK